MQTLALVWGMLAMVGLGVGFLPCLGALNWLNIPFAVVGLIISVVASSNAPIGRRGTAVAGLVLNAIAIVLGALRLFLGAGIV
jgi:hypothetical protein